MEWNGMEKGDEVVVELRSFGVELLRNFMSFVIFSRLWKMERVS